MFGDLGGVRCGDVGLVLVCDVWVSVCGDSCVGVLCCVLSVLCSMCGCGRSCAMCGCWCWCVPLTPSNPTPSHRLSI